MATEERLRILREAKPDTWLAFSEDESKLTARERIQRLLDPDSLFFEIGLLVAHDLYDGQAPAAGVVTGIGRIDSRPVVVVANDRR